MPDAARRTGWIFAAHLAAGLLFLAPGYIRPDSVATYAWLRSIVFDRDLSFFNEWAMFGMVRNGVTYFSEVTQVGALANHWWIGTSLMTSPFYLLLRAVVRGAEGFLDPYGSLLAWTSVLFAASALAIGAGLLRARAPHAAVALVATSLGTPLFWYTFRFPLGTHAAGALCIALILISLTVQGRDGLAGAATGLATGLAVATRLQHFVLVPMVIVIAIRQRRSARWWIAAIASGSLPLIAQAIAWNAVYGTPFGPITRGANLAGVTWMPFQHLSLGLVLFSSYHGLLAWSPVVAIAIVGWWFGWKSGERDLALACALAFALEWLANGMLDRYFWGGMSFGGRRFVDLAVPFALGIGWFAARFGTRISVAIVAPLVAWNAALMVAAHAKVVSLARYMSGGDLIAAVLDRDTWSRAVAMPLHAATSLVALALVVVVAAVAIVLRKRALPLAISWTLLFIIATAISAAKTPKAADESRAALRIDVRKASRFGALSDERGLLLDEIAWARATGDVERANATTAEVAAIDRLLAEMRP